MTLLLDSNIVIASPKAEQAALRNLIADFSPAVSAVSVVEVLGFHRLSEIDKQYFEAFFSVSLVLPIGDEVIERAVALRQRRRMSLGDALIAATALVNGMTLATANERDFAWIDGLTLMNPLVSSS